MADQEKQAKQSTPPPLLLMGASQGLTLNPPQAGNVLFPVPQVDSSLFPTDEGGEEDSFIGQSQATSNVPFTYFQQAAPPASDPFASVGQAPFSAPPAQMTASPPESVPLSQTSSFSEQIRPVGNSPTPPPSVVSSTPQSIAPPKPITGITNMPMPSMASPAQAPLMGATPNYHRQKGPLRYAQPPAGTYAPSPMVQNFAPQPFAATMPPPQPKPVTSYVSPDTGSQSSSVSFESPEGFQAPGPYVTYIPVQYHWFYLDHIELRQLWCPFSIIDSNNLEQAFRSGHRDNVVISTDGGRYDVDVIERTRSPIYWEGPRSQVRRCSWFYRPDGESRFVPYEENFAEKLEEEYKNAVTNNVWHKRLDFPGGETIVMHNPNVIVNFNASAQPDQWGNSTSDGYRPRVVKRGVEEAFEKLTEGEQAQIDHLVFIVHGIGSTCDLRFRNIIECVDDFRTISGQMLKSHFRQHLEERRIGRVEFLPVRWHSALHGDATGVDRKLKAITLNSIGKLRHFTNDTLLDILFYSSPTYAQKIADTVGAEMNRLHKLFLSRNPTFKGGISVSGHSLGSLILFDLLSNQNEPGQQDEVKTVEDANVSQFEQNGDLSQATSTISGESTPNVLEASDSSSKAEITEEAVDTIDSLLEKLSLQDFKPIFEREHVDMETLLTMCSDADIKEMGLPMGPRKKLQGFLLHYKQKQERQKEELAAKLKKEAEKQAAEQLQVETKKQEEAVMADHIVNNPLIQSASNTTVNYVVGVAGTGIPYVSYPQLDFQPHHFFALGSPIAMFLTVRGVEALGDDFRFPTCASFFNIFHPFDPVAYRLEPMIVSAYPPKPVLMPHHMGRKRLHLELKESLARMGSDLKQKIIQSVKSTWRTLNEFAAAHRTNPQEIMEQEVDSVLTQMSENDAAETESLASSMPEDDILVGNINQGRRIDYVLQEKPIESFNDYLFALGSHACYWESEDTVLMILKEVYAQYGFAPVRPGKDPSQRPGTSTVPPPPMAGSGHGLPPQSFTPSGPSSQLPTMITTTTTQGGSSGMVAMDMQSRGPYGPGVAPPPAAPSNMGPPPLSGFVPKK